jgi:hypothetical protein
VKIKRRPDCGATSFAADNLSNPGAPSIKTKAVTPTETRLQFRLLHGLKLYLQNMTQQILQEKQVLSLANKRSIAWTIAKPGPYRGALDF